MRRVIVALTGGIASGKTLASDQMAKTGFEIIDADIISRQVVEKGSEVLLKLVGFFGRHILTDDGELNRPALKKIVFNDGQKLKALNQMIHPAIKQAIKCKISESAQSLIVLVIPLLSEDLVNEYHIDRVMVVDVNSHTQLKRVMTRDGVDVELAKKIMASQITRKERLMLATDIVANNKTKNHFKNKIFQIINFYKKMKH